MGVFACILFGMISSWIVKSLFPHSPGGFLAILTIGLISGISAVFAGIAAGWGDTQFNLYNVFIAIGISSIVTFGWVKARSRSTSVKHIPVTTE